MKPVWQAILIATLLTPALSFAAENAAVPPLPSLETVLKQALERAAQEDDNNRLFKQRYRYTRSRVTEYRNSTGDLKKREEKENENNPAAIPAAYHPEPGETKPGPDETAGKNEAVTDTHSNVRGKVFERKDFQLNDDFLNRFQFSLIGREIINGRPALVLDFKPANKALPERNIKDRFINLAAGRVWMDEMDYAFVKADLHLTGRVNVVGGLVGAVWKFNYLIDRERTAEGLWFERDAQWHLEGREVFIRRRVDYHESYTDVRKVL